MRYPGGSPRTAGRAPRGSDTYPWHFEEAASLGGPCRQRLRPLQAYGEVRAHTAPGKVGPQPQPHFIRGPRGRSRLGFPVLRRRSKWFTWSEAAGRFAHMVKCVRIWLAVSRAPQLQPHSRPPVGGRAWLTGSSFAGPRGAGGAGRFGHLVKCARITWLNMKHRIAAAVPSPVAGL
jgi:hypothetical protein